VSQVADAMTVPTALLVTSVAQEEEGDMVAVVSDFVQFAAPMEKPAAPLRTHASKVGNAKGRETSVRPWGQI